MRSSKPFTDQDWEDYRVVFRNGPDEEAADEIIDEAQRLRDRCRELRHDLLRHESQGHDEVPVCIVIDALEHITGDRDVPNFG